MANKVSLTLDLFDDLREALRNLPEDLHDEAFGIMESTADAAMNDIRAAYPVKTGNLRNGVIKEVRAGLLKTVTVIKNTAPHAWIYEHGTAARHFTGTDKSGRHYIIGDRGQAKAGNVFIPRMIRSRRQFYDDVAELMERHGLLVTGKAA